jgi:2-succinyl-6-hydroxy-2,4-cyclohexadiene-1-carboxylate synthase
MGRVLTRDVSLHIETGGSGPPLVLLHGFTGSSASWTRHIPVFGTRYTVVAIDLLGHGASDAPAEPLRYRIDEAAQDILGVLDHLAIARASVLGYSMGGRLALVLATMAPERIDRLVLESASPGLQDPAEREERMTRDSALADAIERDGVAAFVDRWERHPLFASQVRLAPSDRDMLRAVRLAHSARGLANSLRGMGQGAQPPLHGRLPILSVPALVIVGALDTAYVAIGRGMSRLIPRARLVIVPDAGHAVHLEQPDAFRQAVLEFLEGVPGKTSLGAPEQSCAGGSATGGMDPACKVG